MWMTGLTYTMYQNMTVLGAKMALLELFSEWYPYSRDAEKHSYLPAPGLINHGLLLSTEEKGGLCRKYSLLQIHIFKFIPNNSICFTLIHSYNL